MVFRILLGLLLLAVGLALITKLAEMILASTQMDPLGKIAQ